VDGFGLLDRANLVWITSEVLPPSGTFAFTFGVPSTMSLLGATLFFQAVAVQVGATSSGATAQRFPNGSVVPGPVTVNRSAIGNPVLVPITP
jgi:hypothetical protein